MLQRSCGQENMTSCKTNIRPVGIQGKRAMEIFFSTEIDFQK